MWQLVRALMQRHIDLTGSPQRGMDSGALGDDAGRFIKVFPHEYKRVMGVARADAVYVSGHRELAGDVSPMVATGQVQHG